MPKSKTPKFLKTLERSIRNTKLVRRIRNKPDPRQPGQRFGLESRDIADYEIRTMPPISIKQDPALYFTPSFNILIPSLFTEHMTGGPNTIFAFGAYLASLGHRIRFISTNKGCEKDTNILVSHLQQVSGIDFDIDLVAFANGCHEAKEPVSVGYRDRFMATAWWTFHDAQEAAARSKDKVPYYFVQDFEEIFYDGSEMQVRCRNTYLAPHHAIYNSVVLKQFYDTHFYIHGEDDQRQSTQFFQPTFPTHEFYPEQKTGSIKVLFYARPTKARRNLYDMGLKALEYLSHTDFLTANDVEVFAIGEAIDNVDLGNGNKLSYIPWKSYEAYAELVRSHDIALSLMWAPHPSYLPLEAAHSGNLAITTPYANKRQATFDAWGLDIIAADASVAGIVAALQQAVHRAAARRLETDSASPAGSAREFPTHWSDSFEGIVVDMPQVEADKEKV